MLAIIIRSATTLNAAAADNEKSFPLPQLKLPQISQNIVTINNMKLPDIGTDTVMGVSS
jgi:hypothetical protein